MKKWSSILCIIGSILGIMTFIFFTDCAQYSLLTIILEVILPASVIICALFINKNPKISGALILIICSIAFVVLFPTFIIPVPFLILGGAMAFLSPKETIKTNIKSSNKYSKIFIATLSVLLCSEIIYGVLSYCFYYGANPQDMLYWKIFLFILATAVIIYSLLYSLILNKIYLFPVKYLIIYNSILGMILIISTILSSKINNVPLFSLSDCLAWLLIGQLFISFILKQIYSFSLQYLIKYNIILAILLIILMILHKINLSLNFFLPPFDFLLLFLVAQLFIALFYKYKNPLDETCFAKRA